MPLGISESALRRAYGPIDLTYAYNKIDSLQRQLAAEDRVRKQEAAKQYYTDLASMEKEKVGVRSIDIPEVSNLYKEWSATEKQLASNPNLINRNPELYGELKNKSNKIYSTLVTTIRGSKELGKQEVADFKEMANPQKMDFYRENAAADYKQSVMNKPWSEVLNSNSADITKYYEQKIDGSKFYGDLGQRIESQATGDHKIIDATFKGAPGEFRYTEFKKMPMLGEIPVVIAENLSAKLGKKADKFATQELFEARKTGDYDAVKQQWNKFLESGYQKYFDKEQPVIALFDKKGISDKQDYVNYLTAKEYLSKLPEGSLGKAQFESESSAAKYRESIRKTGKEGEKEAPFRDLYSEIDTSASVADNKGGYIGRTISVLPAGQQDILINTARELTGMNWVSGQDIQINKDKNTGVISIRARKPITYKDESGKQVQLYATGQKIGDIEKQDINTKANTPYGKEAKIEAISQPEQKQTKGGARVKTWAERYTRK